MYGLSLYDLMYIFILIQVILILSLVFFLKESRQREKLNSVPENELDEITLPPIEGIIYPGQESEKREA